MTDTNAMGKFAPNGSIERTQPGALREDAGRGMILGVFPQLLKPGGIQRVGRHSAASLSSFAREHDQPLKLFSLNDPAGGHEFEIHGERFTARGFGRNKPWLALATLAVLPRVRTAYFGHPNLAPLGLPLKLRPGSRYVVETHGLDIWATLPLIRRLGVRHAHFITAASTYTARRIAAAQGVAPDRVVMLPWAVDPCIDRGRTNPGSAAIELPAGQLILTVTRLAAVDGYKGVDRILLAMPAVLDAVPRAHYLVVGDGEDRPRLERLAAELGIASHVTFLGAIGDAMLPDCYRACDVFAMPSREEDFGLVFLEAMAHAKPVIGGNHGGTPDVVLDGANGFLVNHEDVETLAMRLIALLSDSQLRARMGAEGRARVESLHTFDRFRARLFDLLAATSRVASNPR